MKKPESQKYDPAKIEKKWQKKWASSKIYKSKEDSKTPKFYALDMFPYPSGEGLHVGHPKGYIATDIVSRYKRMKGYSVLHPMGFDAFGLPAENYAIKTKTNPADSVAKNVVRYKKQLEILGFDYDWSREVNTTDPKYYKWTQWIFLQMLKKGLAYESYEPVNWCPTDKTVLANEDVEDGRCERCGTLVEKRPMKQWVLKITDYADRLLNDLDAIDIDALPHVIDKKNPPREGKKTAPPRRTIHAIVKDPKTGKYLGLKWKNHPWTTFIVGGVEAGEDIIDAAKREVVEETGYSDIKFIKVLGGPVKGEYFAAHKDVNRVAVTSAVLFELVSDRQTNINEEEKKEHDPVWLDAADVNDEVMTCAELPFWMARLDFGEPMFETKIGEDAVRADMPFIERNAVIAIVKHWSEDKFITLKWKKVDWQTFITGGPEGNQTAEEGALTEIKEETGYQNARLIRKIGRVHAKFFHGPKQINRHAHFDAFYFELEDGVRNDLTEEEKSNHEVVWVSRKEVLNNIKAEAQRYIWAKFLSQEEAGKSFNLLDWPESIKEAQRNWIGRSEGAEVDFRITFEKNKPRFVILHGFEGGSDKNFIPWLKSTLEKRGYEVQAPQLPNTNDPKEDEQVNHVLTNCTLDENTILIGHSLGAIVAMKALMKVNKPISGLVIVAAAIDPAFPDAEPRPYAKNFTWNIDYELIKKLTYGRMSVISDTQEKLRSKYLKYLADKLGAWLRESVAKEEHFCATEEPATLEAVTGKIKVFTTRPDTIFGVTYIVLSPEHPWVTLALDRIENRAEVEAYIDRSKSKTEIERTSADKDKTGVQLKNIVCVNPANEEVLPVWIADYVLPDYGTGAVMAVPAHDKRDFEFAKKFNLPIKKVIKSDTEIFTDHGELIDSGQFSGKQSHNVLRSITEFVDGHWVTKYKLRDWVFSRQRYWGEPIPVIHCKDHGAVPVPEKDLPVKLPRVKSYEPTGTGESPLANIPEWVNTTCPLCEADAKKTKHIVFDFDGVLGDTWKATIKTRMTWGDLKNENEAIKEFLDYFDKKPSHVRSGNITEQALKDNLSWTIKFATGLLKEEIKLFTGFIKEISKLKNTKLAVVSSGSELYVKSFSKKTGLDFTHILCYEDHHSKEEKIEIIAKDWGVSVNDIYYFTDTKADVYELENLLDRKKIIGCSWGFMGRTKLMEALPEEQILDEFKDIHQVFNHKGKARRETNTMPQWAGSSWYYLRYEDPKNDKKLVDPKKEKYWSPVDLYVGGAEHATRHLIYARFWHKLLFDIGAVYQIEPFKKLQNVGLIMGEDGRKMSKRFGNVINPDQIVGTYGADTLRIYEMFMGPFDQQIAWSTNSIVGARRFIERVWKLQEKIAKKSTNSFFTRSIHKTIKKVTEDIENLRFNTAISALMILSNELEKTSQEIEIPRGHFEAFLKLLSPFAPHVTEEIWSNFGNKKSIHLSSWPLYDAGMIEEDEVQITVQVNGKVRSSFRAMKTTDRGTLEGTAKGLPEVQKWLTGKEIKKIIVIEGKLVSIVTS
jgi:leucyl-tRNA synthetase